MRLINLLEWHDALQDEGVPEQSAAIMSGLFAIALALKGGFDGLTNDKAFGAMDLHTVHIEDAIKSIAESIDNAVNNQ